MVNTFPGHGFTTTERIVTFLNFLSAFEQKCDKVFVAVLSIDIVNGIIGFDFLTEFNIHLYYQNIWVTRVQLEHTGVFAFD